MEKAGERVAGMTEYEAKSSLLYIVRKCEETLHCDECPAGCKEPSMDTCMNRVLDEAIRDDKETMV